MRLWFTRKPSLSRKPPTRLWFEDSDGTFYRNIPLITRERDQVMAWPDLTPGKHAILKHLFAEWDETFRVGLQRKDHLDPGDGIAQSASFRVAYPDKPGLWVLDDMKGER